MENTFPVRGVAFTLRCVLLAGMSLSASAQTSDVRRLIEGSQGDAVSVVAMYGSGPRSGFGVIVDSTADGFVVATAKHIVLPPNTGQHPDSVSLRTGSGRSGTADQVITDSSYDVAFIVVRGSGSPVWNPRIASFENASPGEHAWIYGYADTWSLKGDGTVASADEGNVQIKELDGWPGQSGAPVFTARGLIGIYLSAAGAGMSNILPISTVRTEAGKYNVSWNLSESGWVPRSVMLSISGVGAIEGQVKVRNLRTDTTYDFGTHEAYTGRYVVVYPTDLLQCAPQTFEIPLGSAMQSVTIRCRANLSGQWRNPGYVMLVNQISDSEYQFTGLPAEAGSDVPASGRLMLMANEDRSYLVTGEMAFGMTLTGKLVVSTDSKHINLHVIAGSGGFDQNLERRQ